jgi:hypothetical protein
MQHQPLVMVPVSATIGMRRIDRKLTIDEVSMKVSSSSSSYHLILGVAFACLGRLYPSQPFHIDKVALPHHWSPVFENTANMLSCAVNSSKIFPPIAIGTSFLFQISRNCFAVGLPGISVCTDSSIVAFSRPVLSTSTATS